MHQCSDQGIPLELRLSKIPGGPTLVCNSSYPLDISRGWMDSQIDRHYPHFGKKKWNIKPNFFNIISSGVQIKFQNLKSPLTTVLFLIS